MAKIEIFDSTLRDGAQGEGISFSIDDKMKILKRLDKFGVAYVEAGNPASNPKDLEFFRKASGIGLSCSRLVAFGATRRKNMAAKDDENLKILLETGVKYISVFGKSSLLHVEEILGTTPEENLSMISDTISFLSKKGRHVFFDAEHFFDGYKENPEYAMETLRAAQNAGAQTVVLCDTNGGCFPEEIGKIVKEVKKQIRIKLSIHTHNDNGCATAGALAAVRAGCEQVQGTFIGIGERCGNANLSAIIPNLQLKMGYSVVSDENLKLLTETARFIAEVSNIKLMRTMPYIGTSAFAHKAGMHADGVAKNPRTYEHIEPDSVGNERFLIMSEVSGRSAVLSRLVAIAPDLDKNSPEIDRILTKVKELEATGMKFEAASASFEMLALRETGRFTPHFEIEHFHVISSQSYGLDHEKINAMIKVKVGDEFEITAAEGDGPVHAMDNALRKALEVFYPELHKMKMVDYKVRVISAGESTAANTRVLMEFTDGEHLWTTVGASKDIISASMTALVDALEYMLNKFLR